MRRRGAARRPPLVLRADVLFPSSSCRGTISAFLEFGLRHEDVLAHTKPDTSMSRRGCARAHARAPPAHAPINGT